VVTVKPAPTPAAPSNLNATATSSSQINLAWSDNSNNETGFKIERSTDGSSFTQIGTVGSNVTSYPDSGLSESTKYYYRVRASSAGGDSGYSNIANATTALNAPTNLSSTEERRVGTDHAWSSTT